MGMGTGIDIEITIAMNIRMLHSGAQDKGDPRNHGL